MRQIKPFAIGSVDDLENGGCLLASLLANQLAEFHAKSVGGKLPN